MTAGIFDPADAERAALFRPAETNTGAAARTWFDDGQATRPRAQDLNRIIAQFRTAGDAAGVPDVEGDDNYLRKIIVAMYREKLLVGRSYYVRPDGNDANDGLVDSAGRAFLTINRAIHVAATLDGNSQAIFVNLADNTYPENVSFGGSGIAVNGLYLIGNAAHPENVVIDGGSGDALDVSFDDVLIDGITFKTSNPNAIGVYASNGAKVYFTGNVRFDGGCGIYTFGDAFAVGLAKMTFLGGANAVFADAGTLIGNYAGTVEFVGAPAVFSGPVFAAKDAVVDLSTVTITGYHSGPRWQVYGNGEVTLPEGLANRDLFPLGSTGHRGLYTPRWHEERPFRNVLRNPQGLLQNGAAGAIGDDAYCLFDGWFALTQSGTVTPSGLANVADGVPAMLRLTNSSGGAQRFGLAQIVKGADCRHMRDRFAGFSALVRCSAAQDVMISLLEWQGTEDAVTSDVVNNWASGTFTAGNFFIGTVTVAGTAVKTLAANTLDEIVVSARPSSSMNNLIVLVHSVATLPNGGTLDLRPQLEADDVTRFEHRPLAVESALCRRFLRKKTVRTENGARHISFDGPMDQVPSVSVSAGSIVGGTVTIDGFELSHSTAADCTVTASAEL